VQENQVGYDTFAEKFGTLYIEFRKVYDAEQDRARENGNVVDATTGTSATRMDVQTA
jgi:hypothetical protein